MPSHRPLRHPGNTPCALATPNPDSSAPNVTTAPHGVGASGGTGFAPVRGTLLREAYPHASLAPRVSPPGLGGSAGLPPRRGHGAALVLGVCRRSRLLVTRVHRQHAG